MSLHKNGARLGLVAAVLLAWPAGGKAQPAACPALTAQLRPLQRAAQAERAQPNAHTPSWQQTVPCRAAAALAEQLAGMPECVLGATLWQVPQGACCQVLRATAGAQRRCFAQPERCQMAAAHAALAAHLSQMWRAGCTWEAPEAAVLPQRWEAAMLAEQACWQEPTEDWALQECAALRHRLRQARRAQAATPAARLWQQQPPCAQLQAATAQARASGCGHLLPGEGERALCTALAGQMRHHAAYCAQCPAACPAQGTTAAQAYAELAAQALAAGCIPDAAPDLF